MYWLITTEQVLLVTFEAFLLAFDKFDSGLWLCWFWWNIFIVIIKCYDSIDLSDWSDSSDFAGGNKDI